MVHYALYDRAVNTDRFIEFLHELRERHGRGRFVLYMDSLTVHKSNRAWDTYKELNIEPLYSPVYSPDYNPIEMMFSKLKGIVKRMRLKDMVQQTKRSFRELLPHAVSEISVKNVNNYINWVLNLYKIK